MIDQMVSSKTENKSLFMQTREDYMQKIERLARLITEKYPEISDNINVAELHSLYKMGSLNELVNYYDGLYQKVKDLNIPSYRPHWMFRTKFYS